MNGSTNQPINWIAIIGCGLIGGSFALGLRKHGYKGEIVGFDRPEVLERARERGAIDRGAGEVGAAVRDADVVYLATPVVAILDLLPAVASAAKPGALVTDTGSTKVTICRRARAAFTEGVTFLGGHPMAGKATGGIEHADPELFRGTKYVLVGDTEEPTAETQRTLRTEETERNHRGLPAAGRHKEPRERNERLTAETRLAATADRPQACAEPQREAQREEIVGEFLGWLRKLGAEPVWLDAETHDWAAAMVSHLPQLLSTALASIIADETDDDGLPLALAGGGFRDMVRLAASPYDVWRDICLTNTENIRRALSRLEQQLAHMSENLKTKELGGEFEQARALVLRLKEERSGDG